MKFNIPKVLAKLGTMRSWSFRFTAKGEIYNVRFNHVHYMCTDASGKTLYLIKTKTSKEASKRLIRSKSNAIMKAAKMFALWNDYDAHEVSKVSFPNGKQMHLLGTINDLIYDSKKWDDNARYIHKFTSSVKVYVPFPMPKKRSNIPLREEQHIHGY